MTSEKVVLTRWVVTLSICWLLAGCNLFPQKPAEALRSPYQTRHVWAVVPLMNQSGSTQADGLVLADHLQRQLENASNLDVLPVNRVLAAMDAIGMKQITTSQQAMLLLGKLDVDGLVIGTITAYDPYDPPKLGLALELYVHPRSNAEDVQGADIRRLSTSATTGEVVGRVERQPRQPVSLVSAVLDASDPSTRGLLERYGVSRGPQNEPQAWRRYRISMDLYSEFAAYVMSGRLLDAEKQRLTPASANQQEKKTGPSIPWVAQTQPSW